jgi:hypothetical protein
LAVWWGELGKDEGVSRLTKYKNYFLYCNRYLMQEGYWMIFYINKEEGVCEGLNM